MKRLLFLVCLSFLFLGMSVFALEAQDLIFTPAGGGTYIYENNSEAIYRHHLSDDSNPNPTYLMTNKEQKPGKYSVFISHINHTDLTYEDGTLKEPGFDIEIDLQFRAKKDTTIRVTSIGFERIQSRIMFVEGQMQNYTDTWACLRAWSSYLQMPIYQLNTGKKYLNAEFKEKTITLKAGETYWLSQITPNYEEVSYLQPVHMLADFEIVKGCADINIAALKHTGILGDRSHHVESAAPGHYERERQYKGVADSLPKMNTSLTYTIDESISSGTKLPVTIYNQFQPEGNTIDSWVTHINPQEDIWSRNICTESDMLSMKYYDENKLTYYGSAVPEKEKDPYWYFDTTHSDTTEFYSVYPYTAENYEPNYPLTTEIENVGNACNLGNYGVSLYYKLTINNTCNQKRYVNYNLQTTSNNLVILRDKNGKPLTSYALCKGASSEARNDIMACMEFPPNQTTTYILQVILPTNYPGGMRNSFEVSTQAVEVGFPIIEEDIIDYPYWNTGKEYIKWHDGILYGSTDLTHWTAFSMSEEAKKIFEGNWNQYEITATQDGYIARWADYDGSPGSYSKTWNFHSTIYYFDENFQLKDQYTFPTMPTGLSHFQGITYVTADQNYYSTDFQNWVSFPHSSLPAVVGDTCMLIENGQVLRSLDGLHFYPVDYMENTPLYLGTTGSYFFYGNGLDLFLSPDGLYWKSVNIGEYVQSILTLENALIVNGEHFYYPSFEDAISVVLNNEFLGFDFPPLLVKDRTLVPMRMIFEKFDCSVTWNETTHTAIAKKEDITLQFTVDSTIALVNGQEKTLDSPAIESNGRTYIPLRFLSEELGMHVSWDPVSRLVTIHH